MQSLRAIWEITLQLAADFKARDALEALVGLLQSVGSPTTLCKFAMSRPP